MDDLYPDDGDEGEEDEIPAGVVPKITSPPQELIVDEGRKVELPCFGENTKWFATLWKKGDAYLANNEITVTTDKRISVTVKDDRNTLIIENLNSGDNGEYKCVIYEGSKVITSVTHKVMVKGEFWRNEGECWICVIIMRLSFPCRNAKSVYHPDQGCEGQRAGHHCLQRHWIPRPRGLLGKEGK